MPPQANILADYRARKMRRRGATFREVARHSGTTLPKVKQALRDAPPGRARRGFRREIKEAGGLKRWWDS